MLIMIEKMNKINELLKELRDCKAPVIDAENVDFYLSKVVYDEETDNFYFLTESLEDL